MKKLDNYIRKNGFDYELVERNDNVAIYKQVDNTLSQQMIVSYEVFIIKTRKEGRIGDNIIEAGEIFPSNESFGKSAWTYTINKVDQSQALKKAYKKYNYLSQMNYTTTLKM